MEPGPLSASFRISENPLLGTRIFRDARSSPMFRPLRRPSQDWSVRGHHPPASIPIRSRRVRGGSGEVVSRFVRRRRTAPRARKVSGRCRRRSIPSSPTASPASRGIPVRAPGKAEMGTARGDLDVVPILPATVTGILRKHLAMRAVCVPKGDRSGFAAATGCRQRTTISRSETPPVRFPPPMVIKRGKDRHRVPRSRLPGSGEHVDERSSVHSKVHFLPLPVLRI